MTLMVSVIVPIYNKENYLKRCITSIVRQSYQNLQIILVNDGSTDLSKNICQYYQSEDSRIEVVEQENHGVSSARNLGIEHAKGDYIVFVDADDYIESNYIMQLVDAQKKYPSYLIVCPICYINSYLKKDIFEINKKQLPLSFYNNYKSQWSLTEDFAEMLSEGFFSAIWNKLFRLNLIKKYNIRFNEEINFGEDGLFCLDYIVLNNFEEIYLQNSVAYHYEIEVNHSLSKNYHSGMFKMVCMLNDKISKILLQYNIVKDSSVYYQLLKNIESALLDYFFGSQEGLIVKIRKCNRVLKSKRYQTYTKKAESVLSNIRKRICKSGNIVYLLLFVELCNIRDFMKNVKKSF